MAAKRIIFTVTTDPNYDQRMQRICTVLAEENYKVLLIGRKLPHSASLTKKPFTQKRLKCLFNKTILFYAEYNLRLFFLLLFTRFDALCSIDLDTILPGYLVTRIRKKIYIHDAHELFTEMPELNTRRFSKKVWKGLERILIPKLKYAYTESEGYKKIYEKKYNTPFKVIRNVPFYYPMPKQEKCSTPYILYQGSFNVGRGLEEVINIMPELMVQLWLAGEGDLSNKLRTLVKEKELTDRVKFLGMVKPNKLKNVMLNATIGLNLLDPNNRHYRLSYPNKLFDYIMAGLPQICMNFPAYQQILNGKTVGVLIDDLEPDTILKAINKLLEDKTLYQNSISGCIALREKHNWLKEKHKLIRLYDKVFNESG